jgi:prevent-host-death family protein
MQSASVSIAEGKRDLSRLIKAANAKKQDIVLTNRGKPVAVLVSYGEYRRSRRAESFQRVMEARNVFVAAGVRADEVYKETKSQLEKNA